MPDPLFERLYGETMKMHWSSAEDIRHRGDVRVARRRFAVAVGAFAMVLVVAVLATVVVRRPSADPIPPGTVTPSGPTVTPTPTPTPTPTAGPTGSPRVVSSVPAAAMLQASDIGAGVTTTTEVLGDWMIQFTLSLCNRPNRDQQPATVDDREQALTRPDTTSVNQRVSAYAAGDAGTAFDRLRAEVVACARFNNQLSGGEITMAVIADGFAGEQSMLVETNAQGRRFLHAVVRVGNLITQLSVHPVDEAALRTMSDRAAARLCATTGTC